MKKIIIEVDMKDVIKHSPNKYHLEARNKYHSTIVEDKRRKKAKHKGRLEENQPYDC